MNEAAGIVPGNGDGNGGTQASVATPLREPACHYDKHRSSDWCLPGATIWVCGVCHPPVVNSVLWRRDHPALTYDPAEHIYRPSTDLLTPCERERAEFYRRHYTWMVD
jgi:hypothetical protein